MIKKNLIGIVIVLLFFAGFYGAYSLGKNSASSSVDQRAAGQQLQQGVQTKNQPKLKENRQPSQPSTGQQSDVQPQQKQPETPTEILPAGAETNHSTFVQSDNAASNIQLAIIEEVAPAVQQGSGETQTFYGTVVPFAEANVQSEQGGKITLLKGKEGDAVKKGDVIVRFDDSNTQLELQQAISSKNSALQKVQEAESNFTTVQANMQRYQKLFEDGFIAKQQLDEISNELESARSTLNSARESVTQAEAEINLIKNTLSDFQVRAPISGFINTKNYNLQEVYKASDVIYHLVNIDQVYIEINIPETYIARIREKMGVSVAFGALEGRFFSAIIETILPSGTSDNRTFTVKALVNNSDHAIKPGMFARVNVVFDRTQPEFAVSNGTIAYKKP
ncbi:efflux transporter, MFP component, RND family [Candidatus Vecturithrix granuli]|uniref:Efflux transporter, MFP component, RND family n=1 Tax=Vecturithrix granuli TaxID=1499967 RepID=A0A081C9U4_VECG1|nr:efflux transporter, MFP component, RND family [Candidatus Vecturithrix granuli]